MTAMLPSQPDREQLGPMLSHAFSSINWFLAAALLLAALPAASGSGDAGSSLRQLIWTAMAGVGLLIIVFRPKRCWDVITGSSPALWLLLFYVGLSVLWSPDQWVSFKRYTLLLFVAVIAIAGLTGRSGVARSLSSAGPFAFSMMAAAALLYTVALPTEAYDEINIGWRGFTATKNNLGQIMVLCAAFWAFGFEKAPLTARWLIYSAVLASLVMLAFTRSGGAIVAFTTSCSLVIAGRLVRRAAGSSWIIVIGGALCIGIFAIFLAYIILGPPHWEAAFEAFLAVFGKDTTMTGRSYLWQLMMNEFHKHMWLGQGYGSFWTGREGEAGYIAVLVGWGYPGQAHNGYIDVLNETGLVGAGLLVLALVSHAVNLFRLRRRTPEAAAIHFVLFVTILLSNITESSLLRTTSLMWLCLVISIFEVSYLASRRKVTPAMPANLSPVADVYLRGASRA